MFGQPSVWQRQLTDSSTELRKDRLTNKTRFQASFSLFLTTLSLQMKSWLLEITSNKDNDNALKMNLYSWIQILTYLWSSAIIKIIHSFISIQNICYLFALFFVLFFTVHFFLFLVFFVRQDAGAKWRTVFQLLLKLICVFLWYSKEYAPQVNHGAQFAFKILMIHWVLQFTLRIAVCCVLHRCENLDIHC